MPEGHTIHRHARDHNKWFQGQTVQVTSPQGRFEDGASYVTERTFLRAEAWGKHLFHYYQGDEADLCVVHIHLGLYGRFRMYRTTNQIERGAIRQRIVGTSRTLDLHGPTCCEVLSHRDAQRKMHTLGPDPLRPECTADAFIAKMQRTRRSVGAVLLDQSMIAGIGNVYRAELLLHHQLNPNIPAKTLSEETLQQLWDTTAEWLALGVQHNRIITTTPQEVGVPFRRMRASQRVRVYKRPYCRRCDGRIETMKSANRTLYWCPSCQK